MGTYSQAAFVKAACSWCAQERSRDDAAGSLHLSAIRLVPFPFNNCIKEDEK